MFIMTKFQNVYIRHVFKHIEIIYRYTLYVHILNYKNLLNSSGSKFNFKTCFYFFMV